MNPFLLRLADGTSFLVGMLLVATCATIPLCSQRRLVRGICFTLMLLGMLLVLLSSTPLPGWTYVLWVSLVLAVGIAHNLPAESRLSRKAKSGAAVLLGILTLLLFAWELPYRIGEAIDVKQGQTVCVIGDSLSSGIGRGERCWPDVLAQQSGLRVDNLAVGGARVADGPAQAARIPADAGLVLIELGGDDVFQKTKQDQFAERLDGLLAELHARGCTVAMFELPLPPLHNGIARIQRDLARRYNVTLIPKHCLARALSGRESTLDGLHLSQQGHDRLAGLVKDRLRIAETREARTTG